MPYILAMIGAALLAYVVFLISGVGVAITAFVGIMLIVSAIYWWFLQMRANAIELYEIQNNQHYQLLRVVYDIQNHQRGINKK